MAHAAVHADHADALRQRLGQGVEREQRPYHGVGRRALIERPCNRLARCQLAGIAMRQRNLITRRIKALAEFSPVDQRPLLVGARGAVDEGDGPRVCAACYSFRSWLSPFYKGRRYIQSIIRGRPEGVAERPGRQFARALHGRCVRRNGHGHVSQPAGRRLIARALGLVGQRVTFSARSQPGQPRHQCRFGQALKIDDGVVSLLSQLGLEPAPLLARRGRQRRTAPVPDLAGNDSVQARALRQQRRKRLFHHPVDLRAGQGGANVLQHRQRMNDITQR